MKLYYSPGACSFSCHIALHEAGVAHSLERVDLSTHRTADGRDYYEINPKGSVPLLEIEPGLAFTENAAILQFIADHYSPSLAPAVGTIGRTRLHEMLSFIGSDYHKLYSPLFRSDAAEDWKLASRAKLVTRHLYLEQIFSDGRPFFLGDNFTVADAYLYTVTDWSAQVSVALDGYPQLRAYMGRVGSRPSVKAARAAEEAA